MIQIDLQASPRLLALSTLLLSIGLGAPLAQVGSPQPGEVYREFTVIMTSGSGDWRVTDPNTTSSGAQSDLPNSIMDIDIPAGQLTAATKAELLIDYWGGHPGTEGAAFSLNGNPFTPIPQLTTTPQPPVGDDRPECYMQQRNPVVPVPLAQLQEGNNTLEGTSGNQICFSFNWGQWGWYAAILRVYYDPTQVPHPTGTVTSPTDGGSVGENPVITVDPSGGGGVEKVVVLAKLEDYDWDGDGVYTDWGQAYHRGKNDDVLEPTFHVGTKTEPPWNVEFDTEFVPDQVPGEVELLARIKGSNGLWYVTPAVQNITLQRAGSVRLFKPHDVPPRMWSRSGSRKRSKVTIPAGIDLTDAVSAKLLITTWNGIDGAGPGTHSTKINGWQFPSTYGENHHYSADILTVPTNRVNLGENLIDVQSFSDHHGIEVMWPGPALLLRFGSAIVPFCGDGLIDPGEECDDGNNIDDTTCLANCTLPVPVICGDGIVGLGEACDDGNTVGGDDCPADCLPVAQLESSVISVGSTDETVTLVRTYANPVVVCAVQYTNNVLPVVARVSSVTPVSFDVRLQNPSDSAGVVADDVHCLIVEEGIWDIDGLKIEAFTTTSTTTDENGSWQGESQSYGQAYTKPVVLGQVMTRNDADWSVFWSRGASAGSPPSPTDLRTGKHVGADSDTTRASEILGVIVLEAGHGTLGGIEFEAALGSDIVASVTNSPPYVYSFTTPFAQAPTVAVVSQSAMDGGDGSWGQVFGASPLTTTTLDVSVDEDQLADAERSHTPEQLAYAVFAGDVVYPPTQSCVVDEDCDDGLYCNGTETCNGETCEDSVPVACDDSVGCTVDSCNEATDSCDNIASDTICDNGMFCDGAETCDAVLDCQTGTPPACDDGVGCTIDSCNETTDGCDFAPDDGQCANDLFCDGAETCDAVLDCQAATDPCSPLGCDDDLDRCVCADDLDCDDGLFCNGTESCDGADCQPGTDPCAGLAGCDEATDQCITGPVASLETHVVIVGSTFQTVALSNSYLSPVVVCSAQYAANDVPVVTRVTDVTATSFKVRLQNPSDSAIVTDPVHCLIVEAGVWEIEGQKVEAFTTDSSVTNENGGWIGQIQGYGQAYTSPVVLGQVMTQNDEDWSVFWSYATTRSNPPTAANLRTGKHVGSDPDITRATETLGVIVLEAGHGTLGGIEYEAMLGPDIVQGVTNSPPFVYSFATPFARTPTVAVVTQAAMDGTDGSWAQTFGGSPLTTTTLDLSVDEDQVADAERSHVNEQVAYVVFAGDVVYPAGPSCLVDADCNDGQFCNGTETCDAGDCQAGTPPVCDDGVGCTADSCNETTDSCDNVGSNAACDNGLFCDGAETCDMLLDCRAGTPPICDDGVTCTVDSCNETTDSCDAAPDDGQCTNGLFCDGAETCDPVLGCQAPADPCSPLGCDEDLDQCVCQTDQDCDDGLYCNGAETCDGVECQAGADPCAGLAGCDDATDQCITGPVARLETHVVSVGSTFQTVSLANTYLSPVVVCSGQYADNDVPIVTRVMDVTTSSFKVRLQNPSESAIVSDPVHCLVVEAGVWDIEGLKIEAFTTDSTLTDENGSWLGQTQAYGQTFTNPVVLGQVMTQNDPDWSVFWSRGTSRANPPTSSALRTGKHVGGDPDFTRDPETLGVIVLEAGHGVLGGIEYEAALGPDIVASVTNSPPYVYSFTTPFGQSPTVAVVSQSAMDGTDGSWAQTFGGSPLTATTLGISVDEDQVGDPERSHVTEQVAYAVFAGDLIYPPTPSCTVDADCDDGLYCNGAETCGAAGCQAGAQPGCDDGVGCTVDTCNETTDGCDNLPSDATCDNGMFCDGAETCDALLNCQAGTPPATDDGVDCTADACDEVGDTVTHTPVDTACDNGMFCDGAETCDTLLGCQTAAGPCEPGACDEDLDECVCASDAECDDGLYCNGAETCDGVSCLPGTDPCAGLPGCDESTDQCIIGSVASLETHVVGVGDTFQTVALLNNYLSPVVVCSAQYAANGVPIVTRVTDVTATSFKVRLQNPSDDAVVPDLAHCLVVEEGVWEVEGLKVEAFTTESTVTNENGGWVGQAQGYGQTYANPVVLGQVMTQNDPDWSVFWSYATYRANAPTPADLTIGKHVGSDPDITRATETLGVIVLEAGHGILGGVEYEAQLGPDTVAGPDNSPPYFYSFVTPFSQTPTVAVVTQSAMDGSDGSWAQTFGGSPLTATTLDLSVDEDQLADSERGHVTEQVAYVVFAGDLQYSDLPPPAALPDAYETNEDTPLGVPALTGLLANDTDVNPPDDLIAVVLTSPSSGTLTNFSDDGSFSYMPDPDFSGVDSFSYKARDGGNPGSATATVTLTVNPINDPPVAQDDAISVLWNTASILDSGAQLLANDLDVDDDVLALDSFTQPEVGDLVDTGNGTLTYTPPNAFSGVDTFTYVPSDGALTSASATVTITVVTANHPPTLVSGSLGWTKRIVATGVQGNHYAGAADFDDDGDLDVVATDFYEHSVSWYEDDGSGGFVEHVIDPDLRGAYPGHVGDVDLDGDIDVLASGYVGDRFVWYENDGGDFTRHTIGRSDGPHSLVTVDLDADGDIDLVTSSQEADRVAWYENVGDESFVRHNIDLAADGAKRAEFGDLDGDGDIDVVSASFFSHEIAWFDNDGSESFTKRIIDTFRLSGAYFVSVADMDNDTDLDILAAAAGSQDSIVLFLNDGSANFTRLNLNTTSNGSRTVVPADVDGDGNVDAVDASVDDDTIGWYRNDGAGAFSPRLIIDGALPAAYSVFPVDMDFDGDLDMLGSSRDADMVTLHSQIRTHTAAVSSGGTLVIDSTLLLTTDIDDGPADLTYTLTDAPDSGELKLLGVPIPITGSFTQDDVNQGRVVYVHVSGPSPDGFSFTVQDGGELGVHPAGGTFSITIN